MSARIGGGITLMPANPIVLSSPNPPPQRPHTALSLPTMWREIQGANNWQNLLQPLHPILRREIIRYGQFVMSSYKAFDQDPSSSHYLDSKYPASTILPHSKAGLADVTSYGYEVTKFIYATPPTSSRTHWIGYVAVSDDHSVSVLGRRDVLVSFRGTATNAEWITNLMSSLTPARLDPFHPRPDVKVESGFLSLYTSQSCRDQLLAEISRLVNMHKKDDDQEEELSITLAGHSMGSSLAVLSGYDLAELGLNRVGRQSSSTIIPVTVYSYGGPRVGNLGFKARCEELGVKVLRVVNVKDPVTKMPGVFLNENCRILPCGSCYAHVGVELALDFFRMKNPASVHDLEAYIGWLQGDEMEEDGRGDDGHDFFRKVREFFMLEKFYAWMSWQHGGGGGGVIGNTIVGDLVESTRIEA